MAELISTSRRQFCVGATAAIAAGSIAGAAAATQVTRAAEFSAAVARPAAVGIIEAYADLDISFIPFPDGTFRKSIFVGEGSAYDHAADLRLDEHVRTIPGLREAMRERLQEMHSIQS